MNRLVALYVFAFLFKNVNLQNFCNFVNCSILIAKKQYFQDYVVRRIIRSDMDFHHGSRFCDVLVGELCNIKDFFCTIHFFEHRSFTMAGNILNLASRERIIKGYNKRGKQKEMLTSQFYVE